MELVIDQKRLRERSVSLLTLNQESIDKYADGSDSQLVFIIPAEKDSLLKVQSFLKNLKNRKLNKVSHLVIYPKRTVLVQYIIRELKLHFEFMDRVYDFNIDLIPLNIDLLSLENKDALKEIYIKKEFNSVNTVSQSLMKLQMIFGQAKAWYGKGELATEAIRIVKRTEKSEKQIKDKYETERSQIDGIIVLDRTIDPVTPLCTQFNYQGQLDEFFNIDYNKIIVDKELIEDEEPATKSDDPNKKVRFYLTPEDTIFQQIKDFTLDEARYFVSDKMRKFQEMTELIKTDTDRELLAQAAKEKKYVKKYKEHLTLAMHVQKNLQKPINFKLFEYEQVNYPSNFFILI